MTNSEPLTVDVSLEQFQTKADGMPDFEIQGMFADLALVSEPVAGLNTGFDKTLGADSIEIADPAYV